MSIWDKYKRHIDGEKLHLYVKGVDFGSGMPEVLMENEAAFLVKVSGCTGWLSRGNSGYIQPYFQIFKKNKECQKDEKWDGELRIYGKDWVYNRQNKKEMLATAIKYFKETEGVKA